jgi:hypothetical protein
VPDPAKTSKEYMYQRDNKIQGAEVKIAQEKWKTTIIQRIEKDDRWNPSYKLNSVRKNPWHPNMDNIMFYL